MSDLTDILKRIKAGESTFKPGNQTFEALVDFQSVAKALSHADSKNYLEARFIKESVNGKLYYSAAHVAGGLSFGGEEFLKAETTLNGWLRKHSPSVIQWFFGIAAGVILAALVKWIVP